MPITKQKIGCNDPRHKNEDILSKIALGLVIAITFNTFTSAFLLFIFYLGNKSPERPILKREYSTTTSGAGLTASKRVSTARKNVLMLNSQNINSQFKTIHTLSRQGLDGLATISMQITATASIVTDLQNIFKGLQGKETLAEPERQNLIQKIQSLETKLENLIQSCDALSSECPFSASEYGKLKPILQALIPLLKNMEALLSSEENFGDTLRDLQTELQNLVTNFQAGVQKTLTETLQQLSTGLSENFIYNVRSPENTTTIYGLLHVIIKDGKTLKSDLEGMLTKADPISAALLRTAIDNIAKMIESTEKLKNIIMQDYYNNHILDITNSLSVALTDFEETESTDFLSWAQNALDAFQVILNEVNKIPVAFETLKPLTNEATNPNLFGLAAQLAGYSAIIEIAKQLNPNISNPWPQYSASLFVGSIATYLGVEVVTQFPEIVNECLSALEESTCKTNPEECFADFSSCVEKKITENIPPKIQECLPSDASLCLKDMNQCLTDITSCVLGGN